MEGCLLRDEGSVPCWCCWPQIKCFRFSIFSLFFSCLFSRLVALLFNHEVLRWIFSPICILSAFPLSFPLYFSMGSVPSCSLSALPSICSHHLQTYRQIKVKEGKTMIEGERWMRGRRGERGAERNRWGREVRGEEWRKKNRDVREENERQARSKRQREAE